MNKTILMDVDGFTPIIDTIVNDVGLMTAVVFGRMWRFCQMEDSVCKASLQKIADGIGIDKATVQRHADKLCETGYLKDLTPELRNKPHIYIDTGKAGLKIGLSGTVAQSNVTVAENNTGVAQSNVTVAESRLNKVLNKESKKVSKNKAKTTADPRSSSPEIILYRSIRGQYPKKHVYDIVIKAIQKINERLGRDATRDDILPFWEEWASHSAWNPDNLAWLKDWAVTGVIPTYQKQQQSKQPQPPQDNFMAELAAKKQRLQQEANA